METIGQMILYLMIVCSIIGCVASIFKPYSPLATQYLNGLYTIGHIFVAIAGIFAIIPHIVGMLEKLIVPIYKSTLLEPSLAITSILAVDMGGYQVAMQVCESYEGLAMAMFVGYMSGATIVFSIPVGLRILDVSLHKDFALGIMIGFLSIPFGVFVSCLVAMLSPVSIRETISTQGVGTYTLALDMLFVLYNLVPLLIFSLGISFGLYFAKEMMIKVFRVFGYIIDVWCKIFLALFLIEHFSGFFSHYFGAFPFDSVFADSIDQVRALEIAGYTGLMLSGAFVMCYLLNLFLESKKTLLARFGGDAGFITGIMACSSNVLVGYPLLAQMKNTTRIKVIAFSVCGGFLLGDHLSFSANFQPSLIVAVSVGKIAGGILSIYLARFFVERGK